jgi:predicted nucleic acid-binding protein
METLVLDTSAILNFGHRGQLETLLKKLTKHHRFVTTHVVQEECRRSASGMDQASPKLRLKEFYAGFVPANFEILSHESAVIPEAAHKRLRETIHPGEISVIMLALELKATAVIDDRMARVEARKLKLAVMGTLGLVEKGRKQGWHTDDDCLEIVARLHAAKFHMKIKPGANDTFVEYLARLDQL